MMKLFFLSLLVLSSFSEVISNHNPDDIAGRWMSEENNLEVEIYKAGNEYKAIVIWFDDSDDKGHPMNERCDTKNPDKSLRNQKIIGMEVLHGLKYNVDDDEWRDGKIYDSSSGKTWSAKAWLVNTGLLKVRGYWHFEFLGRNISFKKVP